MYANVAEVYVVANAESSVVVRSWLSADLMDVVLRFHKFIGVRGAFAPGSSLRGRCSLRVDNHGYRLFAAAVELVPNIVHAGKHWLRAAQPEIMCSDSCS